MIKREFGVTLSPTTAGRYLKARGMGAPETVASRL
ncbi:hypothetical protein [Cupriavidus nantongensis]